MRLNRISLTLPLWLESRRRLYHNLSFASVLALACGLSLSLSFSLTMASFAQTDTTAPEQTMPASGTTRTPPPPDTMPEKIKQTASAEALTDAPLSIEKICTFLEGAAQKHQVPPNFFARLIWKESRFDHRAVSPVGAQGIAQFMPYTAKERGLSDPFDIALALPASAAFLRDLHRAFGNWGLAAAAYNAGPTRVANWLKNGGFLPLETEDYILSITGKPVDHFSSGQELIDTPLDDKLAFAAACQTLPIIQSRAVAMAKLSPYPWAVQVAGNFRQSAVNAQWTRLRRQNPQIFNKYQVHISRIRSPMGRRGIYVARIGAQNRKLADKICDRIRAGQGSCIIRRNR